MSSPNELEGEVDHTSFDSDGEDGKAEDGEEVDTKLSKVQPKPGDNIKSISDDETNKDPKSENNSTKNLERKDDDKEEVLSTKFDSDGEDGKAEDGKEVDTKLTATDISPTSNKVQPKPVDNIKSISDDETNKDPKSENNSTKNLERKDDNKEEVANVFEEDEEGDAPIVTSEEPDDTVTDVSPLSSAAISHLQTLDLNHSETEEDSVEQQQSAPSRGFNTAQHHENLSQEEDDYSLSSVSRLDDNVVVQITGARHRKNYSFSNDEVKRIEHENQRLLQQLSRYYFGSRPGSVSGQRHCGTSSTPSNHIPPSALNRLREQKRIEQDNLAFLKRLASVKPNPEMKRSEQMADYERQAGYLGMPVYQITTKKSSTKAGKGHIQTKPSPHSARSTPTATELSTPVPRTRNPQSSATSLELTRQ